MSQVALKRALKKAIADLDGTPHALIGAFAAAFWGRIRATADFDLALRRKDLETVAKKLSLKIKWGDLRDPLVAVATFELEGCPVQLLVFPPAWEELIFSHVNAFKLDRQTIMVVDWKVLVLLKLYAGAPLDLADAQVLLQINGERPSENNKNSLAFLRAHAKRLRVSRKLATLLNATNANSIKGDS